MAEKDAGSRTSGLAARLTAWYRCLMRRQRTEPFAARFEGGEKPIIRCFFARWVAITLCVSAWGCRKDPGTETTVAGEAAPVAARTEIPLETPLELALDVGPSTSVSAPTPAPPAEPDDSTINVSLDALKEWIIAENITSLHVDNELTYVAFVAEDAAGMCVSDVCFAMPDVIEIEFRGLGAVRVVTGRRPREVQEWRILIRDDTVERTVGEIFPRIQKLGARPPFRGKAPRGKSDTVTLARISPPPFLETLYGFYGPDCLESELSVRTLREKNTHVTAVNVGFGYEMQTLLLLRTEDGALWTETDLDQGLSLLEFLHWRGASPGVLFVRVDAPCDRGWIDEILSLAVVDGALTVSRQTVGVVEGYGEGCEDERDGYCVRLSGCFRKPVGVGKGRVRLGPPKGWTALHRRGSDRWSFGTINKEESNCPEEDAVCMDETGFIDCDSGDGDDW
jgi:hypothetical protein